MRSGFTLSRALRSGCQCSNMSVTWVWQIASALERSQEWTREVVKEVLTSAKQACWPLFIDCCMPLSASAPWLLHCALKSYRQAHSRLHKISLATCRHTYVASAFQNTEVM